MIKSFAAEHTGSGSSPHAEHAFAAEMQGEPMVDRITTTKPRPLTRQKHGTRRDVYFSSSWHALQEYVDGDKAELNEGATMMRFRENFLKLMLLVSLLSASIGCKTISRFAVDGQQDQPWINERSQAKAFISTWSSIEVARNYIDWADSTNQTITTSDIVITQCNKWLQKYPVSGTDYPLQDVVVSNPRFTASPRDGLPWQGGKSVPASVHGFPEVKVIVCVNPIVVLVAPGPIEVQSITAFSYPRPENRALVLLQDGFSYGAKAPYDPNAIWFSPDMKISPRSAETVGENLRRIQVPWGYLYLTRQGDQWIVSTSPR